MPDEYYSATTPFTVQDSNFKLGGNVDVSLEPIQLPKQQIMISSASSVDTYFYRKYREWSKKMIMGDRRYVVLDLDCETVLHPTFHGKEYVPLLKQSEIDDALKANKEKGLREYYNEFTSDGGENQVVKRATVIKNSRPYLPVLANNGKNKSLYALAYDPARTNDNSVVFVGELYKDAEVGWKMRIVNGANFLDIGKKRTMQLRTPEQIEILKQMILDYNGNAPDYDNIYKIGIDSGSGGAGRTIADYLMPNWKDKSGREHKGIIDKVENEEYIKDFPQAKDKMLLLAPKTYKVQMFDALGEMMSLGLIELPEEYDNKGFINILKDGEDGQKSTYQYNLSFDEELALKNIDLAKEEIVHIMQTKGKTNYSYDLSPEKKNKMHDDRAYCMAMLAYILQLKRQEDFGKKKTKVDYTQYTSCVSSVNY